MIIGACKSLWVTVHTFAPSLGPPDMRSPEPRSMMPVSVRAVALVAHVQNSAWTPSILIEVSLPLASSKIIPQLHPGCFLPNT